MVEKGKNRRRTSERFTNFQRSFSFYPFFTPQGSGENPDYFKGIVQRDLTGVETRSNDPH
jgi:hypothetical protein